MNELDALRLMARHYPGGLQVLALRIDKKEETLRKELSGDSKFKLGIADALAISDMCIEANSEHCHAFVNSIAGAAGRFIDLPVREMSAPKQDLRSDAAGVMKEGADVLTELTSALADEQISDNELRRIEREVSEAVGKLQDVLRGARARNASGKPSLRTA